MQELEQLEKELRKALESVCVERDRIVQEQLAKEEQRLCVVCQVRVSYSSGIGVVFTLTIRPISFAVLIFPYWASDPETFHGNRLTTQTKEIK